MKKTLIPLLVGLGLAACGHKNEESDKVPTSGADSSSSYLTDSVRQMNPEDELTLNGTVTFDQDNVVRVFPLVSGNVEKTTASLGAYVQKGQDLALIRSGDISTYTNDYQSDKSDLEVAQQQLKNVSAQYKSGFASETDFLTAKNNVKKAQDELSKSANILRVYGGSTAGTGQPYFSVKAPIAGYIVEKNVNTGQDLRADNQNPLYTISSLQQIWVLANVYEQDIPEIKQGQPVDLQVLAYPDKTFRGIISNVSSVLDEQARVLKVRIVLANKDGLLKPDMFATIHVHLPTTSAGKGGESLAVPQKAVVFDRDHYYVIVQTGKDKYEVREVNVMKNTTRFAFVKGGNLKPGDTVVTEGSLLLYNDFNGLTLYLPMNKFIRSIITFALTNRFAVFFGIGLIIVGGVAAFMNTPVETFPDVTNTNVIVITQWPGRSAEEVERFVTLPLETELNSVPRKSTLRSVSLFGLSVVTMIFEDGVDNFTAQTNVANRIASVDLPDGVSAEVEPPYGPTGEIYRFTLESKTKDITELKTIQDWVIERQIKSVPGIADVVSFGGKVKTIEVSLNPTLLANYGFTALDVDQAIQQSNINVGGDVIKQGNQALVVRGIGLLTKPDDVAGIIIDNVNGVPIKVRDVATVKEAYQPRLGIVGRDKQDDVVECIVVMRKGENPNDVIPALKAKIDELNNQILPKDVRIKTFYDRTTLNNYTLHTVGENVLTGIFLVTLILLIFLADWRTTLTVAIVIPLALLFAFICLRLKGMTANLLSIGALDFGIIIDGAVVMVEGLFVMLAHRASQMGMMKFNRRSKLSWIAQNATELGKSIFTSKIIIITALLPIFTFQKVEGKLFSPLAWTIGFALMGSLIVSLTLIPLLCSLLLNRNVRERHNPIVSGVEKIYVPALNWAIRQPASIIAIALGSLGFSVYLFLFHIGSEFLPQLNEGSIYVRASLPYSVSLDESYAYTRKFRAIFDEFPEVRGVISQTGRPNDGTDPTGFFNNEFFVDLYPKEDWKRNISKDELLAQMQQKLARFRGVSFNFSQPISDNVEEAVSGVKGSMAIKIIGQDLNVLDKEATKVFNVMKNVPGVSDLGVFRNLGQPEFRIQLDPQKLARYNVPTDVAQSVIETAIGGKTVTQFYEGERRFDIKVRYDERFRYSPDLIENLMVPTRSGSKIPLKELADIGTRSGPAFVYRENNARFIAIKFSVRNRDLGSTIADAQQRVKQQVKLPDGFQMRWAGEFENQTRAERQLAIVVPISITIIFLILLFTFGSALDAALIILNVPFALIGGMLALWFTGINFSISAGVGFICLFGVSVQDGVILINRFKENLHNKIPISEAIREGALTRVRPVVMTALMASLGLLPAALSTGIGSETQKPLATVMIGGLMTCTVLSLLILPVTYELIHSRRARKELARKEAKTVDMPHHS